MFQNKPETAGYSRPPLASGALQPLLVTAAYFSRVGCQLQNIRNPWGGGGVVVSRSSMGAGMKLQNFQE